MYITSPELLQRIDAIANAIQAKSHGAILYEEYIALPHCGQIILRFNLQSTDFTLQELDQYESLLHKTVGEDFLIDFMGTVYRALGVDYTHMDELFRHCGEVYADEPILPSNCAAALRDDARSLLSLCGLDPAQPVWEIQPEEELHLLLYGSKNAPLGQYSAGGLTIRVSTADSVACNGLTKAAFFAKRTGISLARALLQAQISMR